MGGGTRKCTKYTTKKSPTQKMNKNQRKDSEL